MSHHRLFLAFLLSLCLSVSGAASSQSAKKGDTLRAALVEQYPVLDGLQILCVKRAWPKPRQDPRGNFFLKRMGYPTNHESQSSMERLIYDNEIGIYHVETGAWKTLYRPEGKRFVGHLNLHWNAKKFLFTQSDETNWKVFEMNRDGTCLRQVSQLPDDVDAFEPIYLPDGGILFSSNAPYQCVPCWHGVEKKYVANFYRMNADGTGVRRLCFDQDHDMNPSVRHNGQIIYSRWDYTGINRLFLRPLMTMYPDGTSQRAAYGSNSWFPNGLYYPNELPGETGKFLCVLAGYHGSNRSGTLAVIDLNQGTREDEGIVRQISGTGQPIEYQFKDQLTAGVWPQFLNPMPVTNREFLVSAWQGGYSNHKIGIYLATMEDEVLLIHQEKNTAFLEPIPLRERKMPPALPDRVDLAKSDATVYIQDIHVGPGLKEVPRGVVKELRVVAYDFGYIGMAGNDKIGLSGPWEAMRILGTTPIEEDGSAHFTIPANTPVAFQPLDEEGKAVQLMRSWVTAMPGERMSCVGCHEGKEDAPVLRETVASQQYPRKLDPWYGPARGFDFAREVQPVLNKHCVSCHDGNSPVDLRPEEDVPQYTGTIPGRLDFLRMHPVFKEKFDNKVLYTPAYESLIPYIRRVNVGDDVSMLEPGEYHADTSELVQLLRQGHYGVELDQEAWSRIVTWIDLNGPCHGTWNDVFNLPIPDEPNKRRWELAQLFGGPPVNPDLIPKTPAYDETPIDYCCPDDLEPEPARRAGKSPELEYKRLDLGGGESIELVKYEAGYWMASREISNRQFRLFDPSHNSRYYGKRHEDRGDDQGLPLNQDNQPAIRVSWNRAMAFCEWLSDKTGQQITLPTEEQWEAACRAGNEGAFHFSGDSFAEYENLADKTFATFGYTGKSLDGHFVIGGDVCYVAAEGVNFADRRFTDGGCVTMPVGSYQPNAFGLFDMHGNASEWTLSGYDETRKVVKGGSFLDRPERAAADARYGFAPYYNVHNVGFRIVVMD